MTARSSPTSDRRSANGASEFPDQPDHLVLLLPGDFRKHRQRQDPALVVGCVRELFGPVPEAAVRGKKWERGGIVDRRLHTIRIEMRGQRVTARVPDGVEMIDMRASGRDLGHDDVLDLIETRVINAGGVLARL